MIGNLKPRNVKITLGGCRERHLVELLMTVWCLEINLEINIKWYIYSNNNWSFQDHNHRVLSSSSARPATPDVAATSGVAGLAEEDGCYRLSDITFHQLIYKNMAKFIVLEQKLDRNRCFRFSKRLNWRRSHTCWPSSPPITCLRSGSTSLRIPVNNRYYKC